MKQWVLTLCVLLVLDPLPHEIQCSFFCAVSAATINDHPYVRAFHEEDIYLDPNQHETGRHNVSNMSPEPVVVEDGKEVLPSQEEKRVDTSRPSHEGTPAEILRDLPPATDTAAQKDRGFRRWRTVLDPTAPGGQRIELRTESRGNRDGLRRTPSDASSSNKHFYPPPPIEKLTGRPARRIVRQTASDDDDDEEASEEQSAMAHYRGGAQMPQNMAFDYQAAYPVHSPYSQYEAPFLMHQHMTPVSSASHFLPSQTNSHMYHASTAYTSPSALSHETPFYFSPPPLARPQGPYQPMRADPKPYAAMYPTAPVNYAPPAAFVPLEPVPVLHSQLSYSTIGDFRTKKSSIRSVRPREVEYIHRTIPVERPPIVDRTTSLEPSHRSLKSARSTVSKHGEETKELKKRTKSLPLMQAAASPSSSSPTRSPNSLRVPLSSRATTVEETGEEELQPPRRFTDGSRSSTSLLSSRRTLGHQGTSRPSLQQKQSPNLSEEEEEEVKRDNVKWSASSFRAFYQSVKAKLTGKPSAQDAQAANRPVRSASVPSRHGRSGAASMEVPRRSASSAKAPTGSHSLDLGAKSRLSTNSRLSEQRSRGSVAKEERKIAAVDDEDDEESNDEEPLTRFSSSERFTAPKSILKPSTSSPVVRPPHAYQYYEQDANGDLLLITAQPVMPRRAASHRVYQPSYVYAPPFEAQPQYDPRTNYPSVLQPYPATYTPSRPDWPTMRSQSAMEMPIDPQQRFVSESRAASMDMLRSAAASQPAEQQPSPSSSGASRFDGYQPIVAPRLMEEKKVPKKTEAEPPTKVPQAEGVSPRQAEESSSRLPMAHARSSSDLVPPSLTVRGQRIRSPVSLRPDSPTLSPSQRGSMQKQPEVRSPAMQSRHSAGDVLDRFSQAAPAKTSRDFAYPAEGSQTLHHHRSDPLLLAKTGGQRDRVQRDPGVFSASMSKLADRAKSPLSLNGPIALSATELKREKWEPKMGSHAGRDVMPERLIPEVENHAAVANFQVMITQARFAAMGPVYRCWMTLREDIREYLRNRIAKTMFKSLFPQRHAQNRQKKEALALLKLQNAIVGNAANMDSLFAKFNLQNLHVSDRFTNEALPFGIIGNPALLARIQTINRTDQGMKKLDLALVLDLVQYLRFKLELAADAQ